MIHDDVATFCRSLRLMLAQLGRDSHAIQLIIEELDLNWLGRDHLAFKTIRHLVVLAAIALERERGNEGAVTELQDWIIQLLDGQEAKL